MRSANGGELADRLRRVPKCAFFYAESAFLDLTDFAADRLHGIVEPVELLERTRRKPMWLAAELGSLFPRVPTM